MIKNERQHRITRAHAEKFRATLKELAATPRPKNVHPKLWEAQKAGLKSQLQDLEAEAPTNPALRSQRLSDCKLCTASRDCTLARSRCSRDSRDGPKVIVWQTAIRSEVRGRRVLPRLPH